MDGWYALSTDPDEGSALSVFYFEGTVQSLPESGETHLESVRQHAPDARIVGSTELGGQPAFRIQGTEDDGRRTETVGAVVKGNELSLTFHIDGGPAKARQIIGSVTATMEWG
jgi:hypothetical protein